MLLTYSYQNFLVFVWPIYIFTIDRLFIVKCLTCERMLKAFMISCIMALGTLAAKCISYVCRTSVFTAQGKSGENFVTSRSIASVRSVCRCCRHKQDSFYAYPGRLLLQSNIIFVGEANTHLFCFILKLTWGRNISTVDLRAALWECWSWRGVDDCF